MRDSNGERFARKYRPSGCEADYPTFIFQEGVHARTSGCQNGGRLCHPTSPQRTFKVCACISTALTKSVVTRRTLLSAASFRQMPMLSSSRGVLRSRSLLPSCGRNTLEKKQQRIAINVATFTKTWVQLIKNSCFFPFNAWHVQVVPNFSVSYPPSPPPNDIAEDYGTLRVPAFRRLLVTRNCSSPLALEPRGPPSPPCPRRLRLSRHPSLLVVSWEKKTIGSALHPPRDQSKMAVLPVGMSCGTAFVMEIPTSLYY